MTSPLLNSTPQRGLMIFLAIAVLAVLAWGFMDMRDERSTGERIGDAVEALPHGVDEAGEQLRDRTPAERLGDKVRETTDEIKE